MREKLAVWLAVSLIFFCGFLLGQAIANLAAIAFDAPRDEEHCLPSVQGRCILADEPDPPVDPCARKR